VTEPALVPRDRRVEMPNGALSVRGIAVDEPPIVLMDGYPDDYIVRGMLLLLNSNFGPLPADIVSTESKR
jgi:hypothetical protein